MWLQKYMSKRTGGVRPGNGGGSRVRGGGRFKREC